MKEEGFLTPAGWRFVVVGALVILVGVAAYFVLAEDISIDLDELTQTSTTSSFDSTTDLDDLTVPDVTVPDIADDPYAKCLEEADDVQELLDCSTNSNR